MNSLLLSTLEAVSGSTCFSVQVFPFTLVEIDANIKFNSKCAPGSITNDLHAGNIAASSLVGLRVVMAKKDIVEKLFG